MSTGTRADRGIAVRDLAAARTLYGDVLGLRVSEDHGLLWLHLAGGRDTLSTRNRPSWTSRSPTSGPRSAS